MRRALRTGMSVRREFVVFARKAATAPDFPLSDLPGRGGRMDLVARCICNALWVSHNLRRDTRIHIVAYGRPNPPICITFDGKTLKKVSPDERNIASWIKKALGSMMDGERANPGIEVRKIGFQELIRELGAEGRFFYVMHERGKDVEEVEIKEKPVFVLGDHIGLPKKEESFVERFPHEKVSLGNISYLTSQCITIIHYILDRKALKGSW